MRKFFAPILAAALSAAFFTAAAPANAGIMDSCGIEVNATAKCEIRVSGGCTASCQPPALTVQCSADLYLGCNAMCTVMADVACTTSCQGTCEADCTVNAANFDCAAECRGDCGATCDARCGGTANEEDCRASCSATCGGECDAQCEATLPGADCKGQCQSCCSGSCEAKANMDCQIGCQAGGYVDCRADLQGGCEAACSKPEGALFCNGQYVNVGDRLDSCVADLQSLLQIEVTGYASGSANCSGGRCTAEGEAGFSCAQSAGESSGGALGILGALAAFGLALGRRKNQRA